MCLWFCTSTRWRTPQWSKCSTVSEHVRKSGKFTGVPPLSCSYYPEDVISSLTNYIFQIFWGTSNISCMLVNHCGIGMSFSNFSIRSNQECRQSDVSVELPVTCPPSSPSYTSCRVESRTRKKPSTSITWPLSVASEETDLVSLGYPLLLVTQKIELCGSRGGDNITGRGHYDTCNWTLLLLF